MKSTVSKMILLGLATLALTNCGKKDIDRVSEGQECLDHATSDTALSCLDKIDGLTSPSAQIVRCSIYFVDQGFSDPTRISRVADQITSGSGSSSSSSVAALTVMGFTASKYTNNENLALSQTAFTACQASLAGGLVYLSSMSSIATNLLHDFGFDPSSGTPPTESDIHDTLCTGAGPSTTTKTAMGDAALAAYNQNCVGKDISQDAMCQQFQTAVNGSTDPATIGDTLTTQLCTP